MTKHSACDHPNTKSARAACRRQSTTKSTAPKTTKTNTSKSVQQTIESAAPRRITKVIFDKYECHRCLGQGYIRGFSHVEGGKCFNCNAKGEKTSAKGKRAADAFDKRATELSSIRLGDLKPGDVIMSSASGMKGVTPVSYSYRARTVQSISERRVVKGKFGDTPFETHSVNVVFDEERTTSFSVSVYEGDENPPSLDDVLIRTPLASDVFQTIAHEIVKRFSGATAEYADENE